MDTGCNFNGAISPELCRKAGVNVIRDPSVLTLADDSTTRSVGVAIVNLRFGERLLEVQLDVLQQSNGCDLLLGLPLFSKLGLGITGLPASYPTSTDLEDGDDATKRAHSGYDMVASNDDSSAKAYVDTLWPDEDQIVDEQRQ